MFDVLLKFDLIPLGRGRFAITISGDAKVVSKVLYGPDNLGFSEEDLRGVKGLSAFGLNEDQITRMLNKANRFKQL